MATPTFIHYGARSVLFDPVANECGCESNWESLPYFLKTEKTPDRMEFLRHVIRKGSTQAKTWAANSECLTQEDVKALLDPKEPECVRFKLNNNTPGLAFRSVDELFELSAGKANRLGVLEHNIGNTTMPDRQKRELISQLLERYKGPPEPYLYEVPLNSYPSPCEQSVESPGIWLSIGKSVFPLNSRYVAGLSGQLITELCAWDYVLSLDSTRLKRQLLNRKELPTYVVDKLKNDKAYSARICAETIGWNRYGPAEARVLLGDNEYTSVSVGDADLLPAITLKNAEQSLEIQPCRTLRDNFLILMSFASGLIASDSAYCLIKKWVCSHVPLLRQAAAISPLLASNQTSVLVRDPCDSVRFMLVHNPTALSNMGDEDLSDLIGDDPDLAYCAATTLREYSGGAGDPDRKFRKERIGRLDEIVAADPTCQKLSWFRRIRRPEADAATLQAQVGSDFVVTVQLNAYLRNDRWIADAFPIECLPPYLYRLACHAEHRSEEVRNGKCYVRLGMAKHAEILNLLSREELECLLSRSSYALRCALKAKGEVSAAVQATIDSLAASSTDPSIRAIANGKRYNEELVGILRMGEVRVNLAFEDVRSLMRTVLANPDKRQLNRLEALVGSLMASPNRLDRKLATQYAYLSREQVRRLLLEEDDEIRRKVLSEGRDLNGCRLEELLRCVEGNTDLVVALFRAYHNGFRANGAEEEERLFEFCNRSENPHLREVAGWSHNSRYSERILRFSIPESTLDGRLILDYLGHSIPLRAIDVYLWWRREKMPPLPEVIKTYLEEVKNPGE